MPIVEVPVIVGSSPASVGLRDSIELLARSSVSVLITGEPGVGKEFIARAIHTFSHRRSAEFVSVACAGVPDTLLEQELFGAARDTGAPADIPGKLEIGHGGTIFLDEVCAVPFRVQGLLLQHLDSSCRQTTGSRGPSADLLNARLVASTCRNPADLVCEGRFREDLLNRLNVGQLRVPALRERRQDLPELIAHTLERHSHRLDGRTRQLDPEALKALGDYDWPGNVRELETVVARLTLTVRSEKIGVQDLPAEIFGARPPAVRSQPERRRTIADDLYRQLVEDHVSFWHLVYPRFIKRDIARDSVRDLVKKGLTDARGNYKIVTRLFNIEPRDYKKFLNFLRKHDCQLPFKEYR